MVYSPDVLIRRRCGAMKAVIVLLEALTTWSVLIKQINSDLFVFPDSVDAANGFKLILNNSHKYRLLLASQRNADSNRIISIVKPANRADVMNVYHCKSSVMGQMC